MGQKNFKGSVTIMNDAGRIRLRLKYQKQRYFINLLHTAKTPNSSKKSLLIKFRMQITARLIIPKEVE
jgi:hypothetical protein